MANADGASTDRKGSDVDCPNNSAMFRRMRAFTILPLLKIRDRGRLGIALCGMFGGRGYWA